MIEYKEQKQKQEEERGEEKQDEQRHMNNITKGRQQQVGKYSAEELQSVAT